MQAKRVCIGCFGLLAVLAILGFPFAVLVMLPLTTFGPPLATGWIQFLQRVWPSVRVDLEGVTLAIVATGLLIVIVYRQLRNWPASTHTRLSTASALVGLGMSLSVATVCFVGICHEMGWIFLSSRPTLRFMPGGEFQVRMLSKTNLRQIGLAQANYHEAYNSFPAGGTFGPTGDGRHGWMTYLLPYVDQADLWKQIDLDVPWDDPVQQAAFSTVVPTYQHRYVKSTTRTDYAIATYASNELVQGFNLGMRRQDMTDGDSTTILAGEVNDRFKPWGHPANWRSLRLGINQSPEGFGSLSKSGATFVFADGSVRFLSQTIDAKVLQAMATSTGGESVPEP